jgi:hypothetical protein
VNAFSWGQYAFPIKYVTPGFLTHGHEHAARTKLVQVVVDGFHTDGADMVRKMLQCQGLAWLKKDGMMPTLSMCSRHHTTNRSRQSGK